MVRQQEASETSRGVPAKDPGLMGLAAIMHIPIISVRFSRAVGSGMESGKRERWARDREQADQHGER